MPSYSFPFNRGDVKYKLNELVSQVCAWITQDWTQFASFAGIEFSSVDTESLPAAGNPYYTLIRVSDNGTISIKGAYTAYNGTVDISLYESPTVDDDGTLVTSTCQNLAEYEKVPHTKVYSGPTISADGNLILSFTIYGSSNVPSKVASTLSSTTRRILQTNTDYVVKVVPRDTGVEYQAFFEWTECYRITENNQVPDQFDTLQDGDGLSLIDGDGNILITGK